MSKCSCSPTTDNGTEEPTRPPGYYCCHDNTYNPYHQPCRTCGHTPKEAPDGTLPLLLR